MSRVKRNTKKNSTKKRKLNIKRLLIIICLILLCVVSTPVLLHFKEIVEAKENYNIAQLEQELKWVEEKVPWLSRLPIIRDSVIWLNLNQGNYDLVLADLSKASNDTHKLWLIQRDLSLNQVSEAEAKVQEIKSEGKYALAKGLISAHKGEGVMAEEALLSIKDSKLSKVEQILKYTSVARLKIARNDFREAGKALNMARSIDIDYPLVKITEFDYLLAQGQWSRAMAYLDEVEKIPFYSDDPIFLIKKALLALTLGERELLNETKDSLELLDEGQSYLQYIAGIEAYQMGNYIEAEKQLQKALDLNIPHPINEDANNALILAKERAKADVPIVFLKNSY